MHELPNDDGDKKYVFATQTAPGKFYSAAKAQALANAKTEIASKLESEMAGIIENKLANDAINSEDAESVNQTLQNPHKFRFVGIFISKKQENNIIIEREEDNKTTTCYPTLDNKDSGELITPSKELLYNMQVMDYETFMTYHNILCHKAFSLPTVP